MDCSGEGALKGPLASGIGLMKLVVVEAGEVDSFTDDSVESRHGLKRQTVVGMECASGPKSMVVGSGPVW